jgi:hypothetical protein
MHLLARMLIAVGALVQVDGTIKSVLEELSLLRCCFSGVAVLQ